jgi:site-specific DNA-methyltransferase (adenine-specific)
MALTAPSFRNRVKELRYVSPRELEDHPLQHKIHPDHQRSVMRGILEEIGIADVLLAYESPSSGRLVAIDGHLRKSLGDTPWPTVILDLDDAEAAYMLAVGDEVTLLAQKDQEALARLLHEVQSGDSAVQQMLSALAEREGIVPLGTPDMGHGGSGADVEPQLDRAAELCEQWGTAVGQVWQCGVHRVLCGDCTDTAAVASLMGDTQVALVVTDPPYGVSYADKNAFLNTIGRANRIETPIVNDHLSKVQMQAVWKQAFSVMVEMMAPGAVVYCFMPQGGDQMMMMMMMMEGAGIEPRHELIWVKNNHVLGRVDYAYKHEPILYAWKDGGHKFYGDFQTSLLEYPKPQKSDLHPTMKPVLLIERLVRNSSLRGDAVLDPFLGSGTTLIACENLGRVCYGCELDPGYTAVTLQRWADLTGQMPMLVR